MQTTCAIAASRPKIRSISKVDRRHCTGAASPQQRDRLPRLKQNIALQSTPIRVRANERRARATHRNRHPQILYLAGKVDQDRKATGAIPSCEGENARMIFKMRLKTAVGDHRIFPPQSNQHAIMRNKAIGSITVRGHVDIWPIWV